MSIYPTEEILDISNKCNVTLRCNFIFTMLFNPVHTTSITTLTTGETTSHSTPSKTYPTTETETTISTVTTGETTTPSTPSKTYPTTHVETTGIKLII